jgi:hypothetical protein
MAATVCLRISCENQDSTPVTSLRKNGYTGTLTSSLAKEKLAFECYRNVQDDSEMVDTI